MSDFMTKILGLNWKTNLAAILAFLTSVPQFVTAISAWSHHQSADWRGAVLSIVVAAGLAVAKDSTTHSTVAQVEQATVNKTQDSATVTTQAMQPTPEGGIKVTTTAVTSTKPTEVPK